MGNSYPGTTIGRTFAARGAEFQQSDRGRCSQRRDVVDFGQSVVLGANDDGGPDLDNAVSTLVVRAMPGSKKGSPKFWARRVHVITLPEIINHYKEESTFQAMYEAWLEGLVVIRKAPMRGSAAGRRRK